MEGENFLAWDSKKICLFSFLRNHGNLRNFVTFLSFPEFLEHLICISGIVKNILQECLPPGRKLQQLQFFCGIDEYLQIFLVKKWMCFALFFVYRKHKVHEIGLTEMLEIFLTNEKTQWAFLRLEICSSHWLTKELFVC